MFPPPPPPVQAGTPKPAKAAQVEVEAEAMDDEVVPPSQEGQSPISADR